MAPRDTRRVKQAIHAWKANLPEHLEHIPTGAIAPTGDWILIEPFEELYVIRRARNPWETMALVSWRDALYLLSEDDLEQRTIQILRLRRH